VTPQVRVLRGAPDDVELAALVAGIAAGFAPTVADPTPDRHHAETRRRWWDGASGLRDPLTPGPDAWRWSGRG
jgi:hypothetical protein